MEDEELLRALQQTEEIGELEATDLMQFAYQIASGMVRHYNVVRFCEISKIRALNI